MDGVEVEDARFLALEEIRGLGVRESTIRILEKALKGECLKPIRLMDLPEEFQVLTVFA